MWYKYTRRPYQVITKETVLPAPATAPEDNSNLSRFEGKILNVEKAKDVDAPKSLGKLNISELIATFPQFDADLTLWLTRTVPRPPTKMKAVPMGNNPGRAKDAFAELVSKTTKLDHLAVTRDQFKLVMATKAGRELLPDGARGGVICLLETDGAYMLGYAYWADGNIQGYTEFDYDHPQRLNPEDGHVFLVPASVLSK